MTTQPRVAWNRDELLAALHLYFLLPFGRLSSTTPAIIELASALGRTPSSVSMKLCNFASLDPQITANGRKGLDGASKLDRTIWNEFQEQPSSTVERTADCYEKIWKRPVGPTVISRTIHTRRGQDFFRSAVLQSYNSCCAITDLDASKLLRASHIIPWSENEETRLDPSNGICLNALHDAAFDRHMITLDEDLRIVLSKSIRDRYTQDVWNEWFCKFEGKKIRMPERFAPSQEYVDAHRKVFQLM